MDMHVWLGVGMSDISISSYIVLFHDCIMLVLQFPSYRFHIIRGALCIQWWQHISACLAYRSHSNNTYGMKNVQLIFW